MNLNMKVMSNYALLCLNMSESRILDVEEILTFNFYNIIRLDNSYLCQSDKNITDIKDLISNFLLENEKILIFNISEISEKLLIFSNNSQEIFNMDDLLEKIFKNGINSLTEEELDFLKNFNN